MHTSFTASPILYCRSGSRVSLALEGGTVHHMLGWVSLDDNGYADPIPGVLIPT